MKTAWDRSSTLTQLGSFVSWVGMRPNLYWR